MSTTVQKPSISFLPMDGQSGQAVCFGDKVKIKCSWSAAYPATQYAINGTPFDFNRLNNQSGFSVETLSHSNGPSVLTVEVREPLVISCLAQGDNGNFFSSSNLTSYPTLDCSTHGVNIPAMVAAIFITCILIGIIVIAMIITCVMHSKSCREKGMARLCKKYVNFQTPPQVTGHNTRQKVDISSDKESIETQDGSSNGHIGLAMNNCGLMEHYAVTQQTSSESPPMPLQDVA